MGVEKRTDGLEKEYAWPDQPKIEVPDFIGDSTDKLAEYPLDLSIEVNGEGDEIIDQSPKAGTMLESGSTIRLFLGHENDR